MPASPESVKVLLVDDHPLMREGIRRLLEADGRFVVVGECADGDCALAKAARLKPDIVVMDVDLPGMSGLIAAAILCARDEAARVVIVTIHEDREIARAARRAGAAGYVTKSAAPKVLAQAVWRAARVKRSPEPVSRARLLTPREAEVVRLIGSGMAAQAIAARLDLMPSTVQKHRENVLRKLGLKGTAALTKFAVVNGLTSLS